MSHRDRYRNRSALSIHGSRLGFAVPLLIALTGPQMAAAPAAATAGIHLPRAARQHVFASYGKLPLSFERNQGQAPPEAEFVARGSGYTLLLLRSGEAVLGLRGAAGHSSTVLRMKLLGANAAGVEAREEQPARSNYFIGGDPAGWRTDIPNYARIEYRQVYPGVDLVYYGNQRRLEYDFVVAPGANPAAVRLEFTGARRMRVDPNGDLLLKVSPAAAEVRFHKPAVYQEAEGVRKAIPGRYVIRGRQVSFALGNYDRASRLVIDPVLVYSSYLGGAGEDLGSAIAVDSAGNAYVAGVTSGGFPATAGAYQTNFGGPNDAFVTKLNPAGSALVYSTYLGGSSDDSAAGIAIDTFGNAYVTGTTRGSFPITPGAAQPLFGGGTFDAFVTKLNPAGSGLVYSTYVGGSGDDTASGIAVQAGGSAYITGWTTGSFPVTAGASQTAFGGSQFDAFVTKLNTSGSALLYSTYLGGSGVDQASGIAVDSSGNAYVVGQTGFSVGQTPDFPITPGAYQTVFGGFLPGVSLAAEAFVTKLNADGSARLYSTYLGGVGDGAATAVAVDSSGNAYVTGAANVGFPITPGAAQAAFAGGTFDAFVTKLNAAGSALVYSTYLGGAASDVARAIALDASGNVYVTGFTAAGFPTTPGGTQAGFGGGSADAFVFKLNGGGALVYSTYLGGTLFDAGFGIAADASGNAYITGSTNGGFPTTSGSYQTAAAGLSEAFISKIGPFAGIPGTSQCQGKSISALTKQFGGLPAAAAALGYPSVQALMDAISASCR